MYKKGQLCFKSTMLCFKPQLHSSKMPGQEYRIFIFIIFFLRKFKFGQQWGLKTPGLAHGEQLGMQAFNMSYCIVA